MILDEAKKASMDSLKKGDKVARAIYEIIVAKCQLLLVEKRAKGEEFTDVDAIKVLQKVAKELAEEKENYAKVNNLDEVANIERQQAIIATYLPTMMSEDEILAELNTLDDKSIGAVMRHFKQNFDGKCDMATVQKLAKSLN